MKTNNGYNNRKTTQKDQFLQSENRLTERLTSSSPVAAVALTSYHSKVGPSSHGTEAPMKKL